MTSTTDYPDHLKPTALAAIERQVSTEIAASVMTAAYLDGTARQRRDLRILARRLNGIAAVHGVTLEQAIAQAQQDNRPIVVALDVADVIVPAAVDTADETAENTPDVAPVATTVSDTVRHTVRGHHYALSDPRNEVNDHVCRGCGASGHFGYILDRTPCTAPNVTAATLGRVA